jgi:DHA2 family multidrug resistance protein
MTSLSEKAGAAAVTITPLPLDRIVILATGLAGSLLVNLTGQFVGANIADVQGAIGATPDEASWISTVYTMTTFAGIVASGVLIRTFGLSRYILANAVVFAAIALACAAAPPLPLLIALRAVQGLAAGAFGPAAFVAVFMIMGGPRLSFGLTLLAFVLLLPTALGPVVSGFLEDSFGWRSLFLVQAGVGAALAVAAFSLIPRAAINWPGLKADWVAMLLVSIALAALMLVLSQGTRRFWFENQMIVWSTAACIGSWLGFAFMVWHSPMPVIDPRVLVSRGLSVPILLNLVFRAGFAVTAYLVPQFLLVVQDHRPLEISRLFLWAAIPQIAILPLTWWLLHRFDGRIVMGAGLILFGAGAALVASGTSLFAGEQFRLSLALFGTAQVLFLVPDLLAGAGPLSAPQLPTASLAFNITTLGGTTMGVGLVSNLVTEREKFHSNVLTESVTLYNSIASDRITNMAAALGSRITDDSIATTRAAAAVAGAIRREAWVLSFNDAFLLVAAILIVSAIGVLMMGRLPPLRRLKHIPAGDLS